jgi:hypothetical protein
MSARRRRLTIIPPVSYRELNEGLQVASAAAQGLPLRRRPSESPGFVLQHHDGSAEKFGITDHPMNLGFYAIYDYVDRDFVKAWRILTRIRALGEMLRTESAKPWMTEGDAHLHFALLEAAAFMPLSRDLAFDEKGFFVTVERIAARADADRPPAATGEADTSAPLEVPCEAPRPADSQVNSEIGIQRAIKRRHRKFREEIEAVRILARTMLAEKASHREVCLRLRDMARPPNAVWRHLPWDKAYLDTRYRSAVCKWLSGNCRV